MIIEINNCLVLNVFEKCLIIKNGRLFNTNTNEYEAIEGDKITFCASTTSNSDCWVSGTVDGYTCNRRIKLRGVRELYASKMGTKKTIEHLSKITDSDCENDENEYVSQMESEWEAVLSE